MKSVQIEILTKLLAEKEAKIAYFLSKIQPSVDRILTLQEEIEELKLWIGSHDPTRQDWSGRVSDQIADLKKKKGEGEGA